MRQNLRGRNCELAVLAILLFLIPTPIRAQDGDSAKQLTEAFVLDTSAQARYAQNLDEATFYVQLAADNLRSDLTGTKCVDQSFLSWIRKFFKQDAKSISLVATVRMPDATTQKIPLFQVSMDEKAKPPQCLTSILTSEPITPIFVGRQGSSFKLDVQALTQSNVTLTPAATTVAAASDLLSMTGGSAWLLKNVATTQTAVSNAVSKIDSSLSSNWSSTNQTDYQFAIGPWPSDGNWSAHQDLAKFAAGSLVAKAGGVNVDTNLLPTLTIGLQYRTSVFGTGPGHYVPEDQILSTRLASNQGDSLVNILKLGIGGFTTDKAVAISDATAMTTFCNGMRQNFANFLTVNDALAARHAVLLDATGFYQSSILRNAPGCESDSEVAQLKTLSNSFTFPPDIARETAANRSNFVRARGSLITTALLAATGDKIQNLVADQSKFALLISGDVKTVFPNITEGQSVGGIGASAIAQLAGAGPFRTGCWAAIPAQSLRNIVGMALNKKTGNSAAILIEFDSNFPGAGTNPSKDAPKVTKISFMPVSIVQTLTGLPDWPSDSCPLT